MIWKWQVHKFYSLWTLLKGSSTNRTYVRVTCRITFEVNDTKYMKDIATSEYLMIFPFWYSFSFREARNLVERNPPLNSREWICHMNRMVAGPWNKYFHWFLGLQSSRETKKETGMYADSDVSSQGRQKETLHSLWHLRRRNSHRILTFMRWSSFKNHCAFSFSIVVSACHQSYENDTSTEVWSL